MEPDGRGDAETRRKTRRRQRKVCPPRLPPRPVFRRSRTWHERVWSRMDAETRRRGGRHGEDKEKYALRVCLRVRFFDVRGRGMSGYGAGWTRRRGDAEEDTEKTKKRMPSAFASASGFSTFEDVA